MQITHDVSTSVAAAPDPTPGSDLFCPSAIPLLPLPFKFHIPVKSSPLVAVLHLRCRLRTPLSNSPPCEEAPPSLYGRMPS